MNRKAFNVVYRDFVKSSDGTPTTDPFIRLEGRGIKIGIAKYNNYYSIGIYSPLTEKDADLFDEFNRLYKGFHPGFAISVDAEGNPLHCVFRTENIMLESFSHYSNYIEYLRQSLITKEAIDDVIANLDEYFSESNLI